MTVVKSNVAPEGPRASNEKEDGGERIASMQKISPRKLKDKAASFQTNDKNVDTVGKQTREDSKVKKSKIKEKKEITVAPRRSSRNKDKLLSNSNKNTETTTEKENATADDEYDFSKETEITKSVQLKSKKNLEDAFEASLRAEKTSAIENQFDEILTESGSTRLEGATCNSSKNNEEISDVNEIHAKKTQETNGSQLKENDSVSDTNETQERDISNSATDDRADSRTNEVTNTQTIASSLNPIHSDSGGSKSSVENVPEMSNVKSKELELGEANANANSSDDDSNVFLSLSRKSSIPDDDDNDEDFEMASSPIQKKRISLQPKRTERLAGGKKSKVANKRRKMQKSHSDGTDTADEKGENGQIESRRNTKKTVKAKSNHMLKNFVFDESNNNSVANDEKAVDDAKRVSETSGRSNHVTGKKSAKKSRANLGSGQASKSDDINSDENDTRSKLSRKSKNRSEKLPQKKTGELLTKKRQKNKMNSVKRANQPKQVRSNSKGNLEQEPLDENELQNTSQGVILSQDQEPVDEHFSPPGGMPMPIGSSSKPVVRRSRSSLTNRTGVRPVKNIMSTLEAASVESDEIDKGDS